MTLAKKDQWKSYSIIKLLDEDYTNNLEYYKEELERTIKAFDSFKEKMNAIIEKGKQIEYLIEFRKMLSTQCLVKNRNLTIIQCADIVKKGECNFHETCDLRKRIFKLLEI